MSWLKNKLKSFVNELFLDDLKKEIKADLLHVRMRIYRELNLLKLEDMYVKDFRKPAQDTSPVSSQTPLNFVFFDYKHHTAIWGYRNYGDYAQTIAAKNAVLNALGGGINNDLNHALNVCNDYKEINAKVNLPNDKNVIYKNYRSIKFSYYASSRLGWFRGNTDETNVAITSAYIGGGSPLFLPSYDIRCLWISAHFDKSVKETLFFMRSIRPDFWDGVEVGTRDKSTLKMLQSFGIKSYFSRCLTLTLPLRSNEQAQKANKVFLVTLKDDLINRIPKDITKNAVVLDHSPMQVDGIYDEQYYFNKTRDLLNRYANEASLVITLSVHCAAPCIAMGIPVILFDYTLKENLDYERYSIFDGILRVYKPEDVDKIDFNNVKAPNIEDLKVAMLKNVSLSLEALLTGKKDPKLDELRDFISNYKVNI